MTEDRIQVDLRPGAFSGKQLNYLAYSYRPINIAVGAVQSGKSWILNVRFALYIIQSPHDRFLICGSTRDTVQDNVIENGLENICKNLLGPDNVHYSKVDGKFTIWVNGREKICTIVGVNNKGATSRLKGKPVGGALLDEITEYPEEPLDMAFARNSLAGALIFCSTNPGSPLHPVFKKFVGNEKKIRENDVRVWNFSQSDNPTLTEERKKFYNSQFEGVFYQRNVLGKWVMAEGAIYNMFLDSENVIKKNSEFVPGVPERVNEKGEYVRNRLKPREFDDFFICADYGTASVTTFLLVGVKRQQTEGLGLQNYYYVIREYYYDSREAMGVTLTDPKLVKELENLIERDWKPPKLRAIYVDNSASSLIAQMFDDGIEEKYGTQILGVKGDVKKSIAKVQTLIGQRRMLFYEECENTIAEHQTYMWDPLKRKKGESVPVKENDHTCDAVRYGVIGYGGDYIIPENEEDTFAVMSAGKTLGA